jgi:hypothetical protein
MADNKNKHYVYLDMEGNEMQCDIDASTPADTLAALAEDDNSWVRYNIACNVHTPAAVLAELAKDAEWDVRVAVACNASTPAEVLAALANR